MANTNPHANSEQEILNESFDPSDNILEVEDVDNGGTQSVAIAAGVATDTVVKPTPGRLASILVTTTGTNPLQVFDNATVGSGKIIGQLPASPALGITFFGEAAANGITVKGNAANPAVTISFD